MQDSLQCRWSAYEVRTPSPGALEDTPGFQDSRAACPPSRRRVTDGQGHQERIDPVEVEPVQGEAPHEGNEPHRERAWVGTTGGEITLAENERANGGLGSFAQQGTFRGSTLERRQYGDWPLRVSNGTPQMPPDAASGSLNSSREPQDARRGTSSSARRGFWGCRAPSAGSGTQSGVGSSPPLPPGATPGSRDLNPTSQDAHLASRNFVRRGA